MTKFASSNFHHPLTRSHLWTSWLLHPTKAKVSFDVAATPVTVARVATVISGLTSISFVLGHVSSFSLNSLTLESARL